MFHDIRLIRSAPVVLPSRGRVTILMGVYNGAEFLADQLQSIANQTHRNWHLIASDDGSTDESLSILRAFSEKHPGQVEILAGPCRGHAANYLSLLRNLPDDPGWIAFADQDDVWLPEKLDHGIAALRAHANRVAIHFSRTWVVSRELTGPRLSATRPRPPSFQNALVQNIASGNTILATPRAASLLVKAARRVDHLIVHDWFVYQLITGCHGVALHDDRPALLYRQHATNSIGANDGLRARLRRMRMLWSGLYADWNDTNLRALSALSDLLAPDANRIVQNIMALRRDPNPLRRVAGLAALGVYRQTRVSQGALYLAAMLGKL